MEGGEEKPGATRCVIKNKKYVMARKRGKRHRGNISFHEISLNRISN